MITRFIALGLLFSCLAFGQIASNGIDGSIEDQSGARIANVQLTLRMAATGQMFKAASSEKGEFRFTALANGTYELQAQVEGFNTYKRTLTLNGTETQRLTITLAAGSVTESVSVSSSAELLQPSRATNSVSLSAEQIINTPTASRNYTHLIVAEAGVSAPLPDRTGRGLNLATSPGTQADDGSQSLNPSVNGARPTNNAVSINGIDTTNVMNGGGGLGNNTGIPLDALEVIEVQTALFSASTGRNGGGNIQMVTKSGSNNFHGSVYHFLQNEKFNANEFFLNRAGTTRPQFRRNESGATFGGRIIRDKTFFFGAVQRTDFLSGYAQRAIARTGVPDGLTPDMPRTRETIAGVANRYMQSGFRDNANFASTLLTTIRTFPPDQIPGLERKFFTNTTPGSLLLRTLTPSDIHPVAVNILNVRRNGQLLLPGVTDANRLLPGNASYGAERELTQVFPTKFNSWTGNGTIEHHFSAANRLRLNYLRSEQFVEEAFPWANSSPSPTQGLTPSYTASMSDIHTFGPKWVNDFRGGFFELFNTRISKFRDIFNSTLGIFNPIEQAIGGLASLMPTVDINTQLTGAGIGNAWDFYDRQRVANVANNVSYNSARHTVQFGGEFRYTTIKGEYMARTNGDLDYGSWLYFFTGHGAPGGGSDLDQGDTRRNFRMKDYGLFFQDDWRVAKGLTINAGIRWDLYNNPTEVDGRIGSYYNRETAAKLGLQPGFYLPENSIFFKSGFKPEDVGLVLAPGTPWNLNQINKAPWASTISGDYNNFAPRIGFAWQPPKMQKLVLRGGFGLFYERTSASFKGDLQLSAPFFFYANVPAPLDMADPYPRLNVNPFQIPLNVGITRNAAGTPSWTRANGTAFPGTEPFSAKSNTFIDPLIRTPYTQQWSFGVQYEPLRGNLLDVRYVGSRGIGLMARQNLTQPTDPRVKPVNGFTNIVNNTGAAINPDFFVDPQYLGLSRSGGFRLRSNFASSNYHGLQANFRRRMTRSIMGNFSYTWSKSLDTISNDNGVLEHDTFNIANNRGPSNFDRTHRFTAAYVVEIPNPFKDNRNLRMITGGWNLSGMATLQSGTPFNVVGASTINASFAQPAVARVSFAPGRDLNSAIKSGRIQDRLTSYFDGTAFANSLDQWGNTGRNILRGPAQVQYDFSLTKTTKIGENFVSELRWEGYNVFNSPVFSNPANSIAATGPGTAGTITSTIGGPRTMQVGLRVRF